MLCEISRRLPFIPFESHGSNIAPIPKFSHHSLVYIIFAKTRLSEEWNICTLIFIKKLTDRCRHLIRCFLLNPVRGFGEADFGEGAFDIIADAADRRG